MFHTEFDLRVARMVETMNHNGLAIDLKQLLQVDALANHQMQLAVKEAKKNGIDCNLNSQQQVAKKFRELGIHTGNYTNKDVMSTGKDALMDLWEHHPHMESLVLAVLSYRNGVKTKGTYVKGIAQRTFRDPVTKVPLMKGELRFPGTTSWRLAGKNTPHLTVPKDTQMRKVVVSRYGSKGTIVKGDYSQLELRVLASLSGCPDMKKIYDNGLDIHRNTLEGIWGDVKDPEGRLRTRAKALNFGVVYGSGPYQMKTTLRKGMVVITEQEAAEWIEGWRATYPVAWRYMAELQQEAASRMRITGPAFGVVRKFEQSQGKPAKKIAKEGANHPIQQGASALTLSAGLILSEKLSSRDAYLVNLPHDELVVDALGDGRTEASLMQDSMKEAAERFSWLSVPVMADVEVGPSWGETLPL